jgi:hypothetical protein
MKGDAGQVGLAVDTGNSGKAEDAGHNVDGRWRERSGLGNDRPLLVVHNRWSQPCGPERGKLLDLDGDPPLGHGDAIAHVPRGR